MNARLSRFQAAATHWLNNAQKPWTIGRSSTRAQQGWLLVAIVDKQRD